MLDVKVAGCKCSVHLPRIRPALEECARNDALIDRMNEIWTSCGFSPLQKRSSLGGSDAANVSTFGIPAVDNLGTFGGRIHTVNEYGLISSLSEQAERIALVALYI